MITVNSVYKYSESNERIRVIELIDSYAYIVNIDSSTSVPKKIDSNKLNEEIERNILLKISDPFLKFIEDKELTEIQISKREEDWKFINKYLKRFKYDLLNKETRTKALEDISKEEGLSIHKVKKCFSRYWQRGMNKNSLIPDYINSGGRGKSKNLTDLKVGKPKKVNYYGEQIIGINVKDETKKQFNLAINKYFRNNKKISLKEVYTLMLRDFYSDIYRENGEMKYKVWDSNRIPSYDQFYYWFKKNEDAKKDIIFREGEKEFNLKHRELLSDSKQETDGPGTRFQIDATIGDIYLVSSLNRNRIIGRPVIYAIIDVFSRLITGIYVGLEGPSWTGAMMALDNMVEDKVEFCKKYGIEISEEQWPVKHLPEIIIADRGEFEGFSVENLINNLNIKIENTSPYRGDLKGIVERSFRTTNEKIKHKTPGAIMKEFRKRGDRDYRLDATLTLEEFTKIYINIVIHHNNKIIEKYPMDKEMIADEIIATPLNLWNWGIENRKGRLRVIDRDIFRLNILPKGKASVSRAGIRFKGLYYSSEKAIQEQWFIGTKNRSVEVIYDTRNINNIYIPYNNGMEFDECYLVDTSMQYKDFLLEEIIFNQELESELRNKEIKEQKQSDIDLEKEIENIVKAAKKNKLENINYNESNNSKLKGIRKNRRIEKEINKSNEKFILSDTEKEKFDSEIIEFPTINDKKEENKETSGKDRLMEMIKRKRAEKK